MPSADVLVMGRVLHDWHLARKKVSTEKAFAALARGSALARLRDHHWRRSPSKRIRLISEPKHADRDPREVLTIRAPNVLSGCGRRVSRPHALSISLGQKAWFHPPQRRRQPTRENGSAGLAVIARNAALFPSAESVMSTRRRELGDCVATPATRVVSPGRLTTPQTR